MSGRDPSTPIPSDFQCAYADPGKRACPASICDCFVATHPDSPFDLHPEDFIVNAESFTPVKDCPECKQGKHVNCTQMVLVEHDLTDNYEPCPCKLREHQEETR